MYMNEIQHIDVEHNTSHHNIITIPFRLHFVARVNTSIWSKRGIEHSMYFTTLTNSLCSFMPSAVEIGSVLKLFYCFFVISQIFFWFQQV